MCGRYVRILKTDISKLCMAHAMNNIESGLLKILISCVLIVKTVSVNAENFPGGFLPQFWGENCLITPMEGAHSVFIENKSGKTIRVALPDDCNTIDYFDNNYYYTKSEIKNGQKQMTLMKSENLLKWENVAFYCQKGLPSGIQIYPIGNNKYIVMALPVKFGNDWTNCYIGKAEPSGEIIAEDPFDFQIKDPLFVSNPEFITNPQHANPWRLNPGCGRIASLGFCHPYRVNNFIIFVEPMTGMLWVFDCNSCKTRYKLALNPFLKDDDYFDPKTQVPMCFIGGQPTKEGTVIIATHCKEYLSSDLLKEISMSQDIGTRQVNYTNMELALRINPGIDWWILDPEEGKLIPTSVPENIMKKIETHEDLKRFMWHIRFGFNGNLTMGQPDPDLILAGDGKSESKKNLIEQKRGKPL